MSVLNYNLYEDMTRESILVFRVGSFCYLFCYGKDSVFYLGRKRVKNMTEKDKDTEEKLRQERLEDEERMGIADDWADLASQELADYIEEQGIQIRY